MLVRSLEKTRHLLRSLSKLLQPAHDGSPAPFTSIEYKAVSRLGGSQTEPNVTDRSHPAA
jgi:hypothetical protein